MVTDTTTLNKLIPLDALTTTYDKTKEYIESNASKMHFAPTVTSIDVTFGKDVVETYNDGSKRLLSTACFPFCTKLPSNVIAIVYAEYLKDRNAFSRYTLARGGDILPACVPVVLSVPQQNTDVVMTFTKAVGSYSITDDAKESLQKYGNILHGTLNFPMHFDDGYRELTSYNGHSTWMRTKYLGPYKAYLIDSELFN